MKKYTILTVVMLLMVVLVLGSCGKKAEEPAQPEPVEVVEINEPVEPEEPVEVMEEPVETEEEVLTEAAQAVALRDYAVIEKEDRGTEVEVLCDVTGLEGYSLVRVGDQLGIMGRQFILMEGQEFTPWKAYAGKQAKLCTGYDMDEETAVNLASQTPLTVIAELDYCYVVQLADGTIGCVANDEAFAASQMTSSSSSSSTTKTDTDHEEGDDILFDTNPVAAHCSDRIVATPIGYEASETDAYEGKGVVVVNQAPLLAGLYEYGDATAVSSQGDAECILSCAGIEGTVEKRFLLFADEAPYESWAGYTRYNAGCFKNIRLIGKSVVQCKTNDTVTVLNEFEESCLVEYNGELYYMNRDDISEKPWVYTSQKSTGHGSEWTVPVY